MKYDIGIIGGGISGLSAGAFLAKLGMKVCIFEKILMLEDMLLVLKGMELLMISPYIQ